MSITFSATRSPVLRHVPTCLLQGKCLCSVQCVCGGYLHAPIHAPKKITSAQKRLCFRAKTHRVQAHGENNAGTHAVARPDHIPSRPRKSPCRCYNQVRICGYCNGFCACAMLVHLDASAGVHSQGHTHPLTQRCCTRHSILVGGRGSMQ